MKPISSRDNPLYKDLKHLASSPQARRKEGRTLLDGVHLCDAYLQYVGMPALCVVSDRDQHQIEVASVVERCRVGRTPGIVLPDQLYHALSQVEHGVGLLFVIEIPDQERPGALVESAILLDNLQDPGNLGSIMRTAAAAGIKNVFCSSGSAHCWSPKVLRAGMGAHFLLKIFEQVDLAELIRGASVPILATSSHASRGLYEFDLRRPVAWLFGHEGQGVAADLQALATDFVAIPHMGAIESLNVAASAAVCLFEQVRQQTAKS